MCCEVAPSDLLGTLLQGYTTLEPPALAKTETGISAEGGQPVATVQIFAAHPSLAASGGVAAASQGAAGLGVQKTPPGTGFQIS